MNQDCEQNIAVVNQNSKQTSDAVNHDHTYVQEMGEQDIYDVGLDVHEEKVDAASVPKTVIPVDTYHLVVELGHIVNQLKTGCTKCRLPLNICNAQGVLPRGLGGWIYITYNPYNPVCTRMNKISLGKQHKKATPKANNPFDLTPKGCSIFDVNTKAASGILHTGIGETHLNNLLSTLNLPQITHRSLKV